MPSRQGTLADAHTKPNTTAGADKHLGAAYPLFSLEPGAVYEWDVCFQLPQGPLPGALYFQGCNGSAKVTYTLSGYLGVFSAFFL